MNSLQGLGLLFIIFGIVVALYGIAIVPLSGVSIGPVQITDIPGRSAASIGVGAFLIIVGVGLFVQGSRAKTKTRRRR
jgi:hypothetical protein